MRIDLKHCGFITLRELSPGDVFIPLDRKNGYYMKIKPTSPYSAYNVVSLITGDAFTLEPNTPVYYINATLINSERTCKNG